MMNKSSNFRARRGLLATLGWEGRTSYVELLTDPPSFFSMGYTTIKLPASIKATQRYA